LRLFLIEQSGVRPIDPRTMLTYSFDREERLDGRGRGLDETNFADAENKNKPNKGGKMKLDTLKKLYLEELRDLYSAETQLVKALPKMAKGASSDELKQAFESHLEQTKEHVERLDEIFARLDEKPTGKTCKAMKGLIEEGSEMLEQEGEDSVIDAGLIGAAQRVEHYEIAAYGTVRTFANLLGEDDAAELLQETLDEEGETDKELSELAEGIVNEEALVQDEEEKEVATAGSRRR
jgi:ferritin-like metal-binding protein YciE